MLKIDLLLFSRKADKKTFNFYFYSYRQFKRSIVTKRIKLGRTK